LPVGLPGVLVLGEPGDLTRKAAGSEVGHADLLEDVAERVARGDPDPLQGVRALVVRHRLGPQPVDRHQRAVDGTDHVGDRDARGVLRQPPAPGLPTLRVHDPRLAQVRQDRLEEVVRDLLELAELLGAHRTRGIPFGAGRHLDEGAQRVVRLG